MERVGLALQLAHRLLIAAPGLGETAQLDRGEQTFGGCRGGVENLADKGEGLGQVHAHLVHLVELAFAAGDDREDLAEPGSHALGEREARALDVLLQVLHPLVGFGQRLGGLRVELDTRGFGLGAELVPVLGNFDQHGDLRGARTAEQAHGELVAADRVLGGGEHLDELMEGDFGPVGTAREIFGVQAQGVDEPGSFLVAVCRFADGTVHLADAADQTFEVLAGDGGGVMQRGQRVDGEAGFLVRLHHGFAELKRTADQLLDALDGLAHAHVQAHGFDRALDALPALGNGRGVFLGRLGGFAHLGAHHLEGGLGAGRVAADLDDDALGHLLQLPRLREGGTDCGHDGVLVHGSIHVDVHVDVGLARKQPHSEKAAQQIAADPVEKLHHVRVRHSTP